MRHIPPISCFCVQSMSGVLQGCCFCCSVVTGNVSHVSSPVTRCWAAAIINVPVVVTEVGCRGTFNSIALGDRAVISVMFNTLRPRQNGLHFADTLKCIFLNENVIISAKISPKFVPKGPINNIPALVKIMAWHQPGDKPLSEPMMVRLPTHICITRPQWVKLILWINILSLSCEIALRWIPHDLTDD